MKFSANITRLMAAVLCLSILSCKKDVMPIDREATIYPRTDQEKEKQPCIPNLQTCSACGVPGYASFPRSAGSYLEWLL